MEVSKNWEELSLNTIVFINLLYLICFLISIHFFIKFNNLIFLHNNYCIVNIIVVSSTCLLIGSIICYSRKIYLISIQENLKAKETFNVKRLGLILYFLWKPLYSVTYSIFIVFSIILFISGLSTNYTINSYQVYFIEVLSYIIGYNNGKFLDTFNDLYDTKKNIL